MKVDWKIGFFIQFSYFDFIDVKIKETLVIRIRPGFCPKFIHFSLLIMNELPTFPCAKRLHKSIFVDIN